MLFSSREPFNDDPMPYRSAGGIGIRRNTYMITGWDYQPRPEYERPQNNPTNPALIELRKNLKDAGSGNAKAIIRIRSKSLDWAMEEHNTGWQHFTPETVAHIEHARKVLTRLSKLT